jgi:dCMP deaminase
MSMHRSCGATRDVAGVYPVHVVHYDVLIGDGSETDVSLEDFVTQDDRAVHGYKEMTSAMSQPPSTPLNNLRSLVHLHVVNDFSSLDQLHSFLDSLDILDQDRLRPAWDTYFMVLSSPP